MGQINALGVDHHRYKTVGKLFSSTNPNAPRTPLLITYRCLTFLAVLFYTVFI